MNARARWSTTVFLIVMQLVLAAGVAFVIGYLFREKTHDYMQHDSDAFYFFDVASSGEFEFSLDSSVLINENSLPIAVWTQVYAVVRWLGLDPTPSWGIIVNALLVVWPEILALRFARDVFGYGGARLWGFAALMSLNGVLMMFAGIHMRDAFLLFNATLSMIAFLPRTGSLRRSEVVRVVHLGLLMVTAFLCRREGFAVPLMIYLASWFVTLRSRSPAAKIIVLGLVLSVVALVLAMGVLESAMENYDAYKLLTQSESDQSSIGYVLLYQLPFPFSVIAGALQLLLVKIPFWRGWLYDSYSFFVSAAALQMLFVVPGLVAVAAFAAFNKVSDEVLFLLVVQLCLLFMISLTSFQVRHFAIGYPFLLLLYHMRREIIGPRAGYRKIEYGTGIVFVMLTVLMAFR